MEFQGRLFQKQGRDLFVWEPAWEMMRPVSSVGWNGTTFEIVEPYKQNLFDPYYGFGSVEMKERCEAMSKPDCVPATPEEFWQWVSVRQSWFRDRPAVLTPCASTTTDAWKRLVVASHSRARTLRHKLLSGMRTRRHG